MQVYIEDELISLEDALDMEEQGEAHVVCRTKDRMQLAYESAPVGLGPGWKIDIVTGDPWYAGGTK